MLESDPTGTGPMQATEGTPTDPRNALAPEPVAFTITLLVSPDVDFEAVVDMTEVQAELFMRAVEEATGVAVVDKLIWDPLHPYDGSEIDCRCTGPAGWHCPGEESEHWAKSVDDPRSECGHCGWSPDWEPEASGLTGPELRD